MRIEAFRTMQGWTVIHGNSMVYFKSKELAKRYILALGVIYAV